MRIRYIKSITVGSTKYKIKYNPKSDGASFNWHKKTMSIGTQNGSKVRILENIIHELKEAIQMEQSVRYDHSSVNGNFLFVYFHDHHTDLCSRLAGLLNQFIK